ncbi:radical SAM protein [Phytoactinopolyspora mesophila]|uniref:Radical SAM protein n=1 Tax=Phytoactinopolyspora mesophila TaxID=2650750 RepID=A0A7K3MAZ5_9ACTN|nr:radical SAM protein [Phytoactinopolyspora mesophila]
MSAAADVVRPPHHQQLRFVSFEITGRCQLECVHCYADRGPSGTHGRMTTLDWTRLIDEVYDMGVSMVQFIGGEPTLHNDLPDMIEHALARHLAVEVYTNLVHVTPKLWEVFARPGVRLATSWYSDNAKEHAAVTRRSSHSPTRANIAEAVRRSIPIRVGLVGVLKDQRVAKARQVLVDLGVEDIGYDDLRHVGRGAGQPNPDISQLCGHCAQGKLAIGSSGAVWPCVFSRWLPVGNVLVEPLSAILRGSRYLSVVAELDATLTTKLPCVPDMCDPQCGPSCSPACPPSNNCRPVGACVPWYR